MWKRKKPAAPTREPLVLEELEPRILFSGGVEGVLQEMLDMDVMNELLDEVPAVELVLPALEDSTPGVPAETQTRELVVVDTGTPDYQRLVDDILAQAGEERRIEVVMLDDWDDGIAQLGEILADHSDLDAVHLISHATDGAVSLGTSTLNFDSLLNRSSSIKNWGNAFSVEGDFLVYGCNLAASADGQALVDALTRLTGADVAASDDLTGDSEQGGDWELEYKTGTIEAQIAVGKQVLENYRAVLESNSAGEAAYLSTPLAFEQNLGQTDQQVDFFARGSGYTVFLTEGDAVLTLQGEETAQVVRLDLLGGNTSAPASGADLLSSESNYLIGTDESGWKTGVANYGAVEYANVYEGIDLRYYGNQRQLEYDFIVSPGADTSQIRLNFEGVQSASIGDNGDLILTLNEQGDQISFNAPVSYQLAEDGSREAVQSQYVIHQDGTIGFELGAYDASRTLVIDPILNYSTYLGGLGTDYANGIAVDSNGDIFVVGQTYAADFPATTGSHSGACDAYVAKLTPNGSGAADLVFATYIGGTGNDFTNGGIQLDTSGNIIFSGATESSDLATTAGAYDTQLDGPADAYIVKLDSTGSTLLYSTYFGGSGRESVGAMTLDATDNVYITGQTLSNEGGLRQLTFR